MAEEVQGLRRNIFQFTLLVVINACVGAMVGMERSILPPIAETEFGLAARTATLSFIVVFGVSKALTNYFAGRLADSRGRRKVLVGGWLLAAPVPFLLMWAPSWNWIIAANVLLGISQGLTWSTTVIMKLDLVGPRYRGLAMGMNEFAGYGAMAGIAWLTGMLAAQYGLRPAPFYPGIGLMAAGLLLSASLARETREFARREIGNSDPPKENLTQRQVFLRTALSDPNLSSATQAGLATNLKDGAAWGLFPLFFAAAGMNLGQVGVLAGLYPAFWGFLQLLTGPLSDRVGRKRLILWGMWTQAVALALISLSATFAWFAAGSALLGTGTAMVYPVLQAAVSDHAAPVWRGAALGTYRLWRDSGYAIGALAAGLLADLLSIVAALWLVAGMTFVSGVVVAVRMGEGRR